MTYEELGYVDIIIGKAMEYTGYTLSAISDPIAGAYADRADELAHQYDAEVERMQRQANTINRTGSTMVEEQYTRTANLKNSEKQAAWAATVAGGLALMLIAQ